MTAKELTPWEVLDIKAEGNGNLLVIIDGATYNTEDLLSCGGCQTPKPDPTDLDDEGFCHDCAIAVAEDRQSQKEQWSDYWASRL